MKKALKVDLHLHSAEDPEDLISHDAQTLVERAHLLGFDALALTLHDRQLSDPRLSAYAQDLGITLIPGLERTIDGRHVLLLNFPAAAENVRTLARDRRAEIALQRDRGRAAPVLSAPVVPARLDGDGSGSVRRGRVELLLDRGAELQRARGPLGEGARQTGRRQLGSARSPAAWPHVFRWSIRERSADAMCEAIRAGRVALETTPVPTLELAQVLGGMFRRGRKAAAPARELATT